MANQIKVWNGTAWETLANATPLGATGPTGPQGPTGPAGAAGPTPAVDSDQIILALQIFG